MYSLVIKIDNRILQNRERSHSVPLPLVLSSAHDFVHFVWKLLHKLNITTFIITATQDNRQASLSTKIFYWKLFSWIPCATAACQSIWMVISKKNIHMAVSYRWTDQCPPLGPPVEWQIEREVKPNTHLSDTQPDSWKWTNTQPDSWK